MNHDVEELAEADALDEKDQQPTVEQVHKERGRPSKDASKEKSVPIGQIPRPPYPMYKSDSGQTNQRTRSFYNYKNSLAPKFQARTILYAYREWPVLKEMDGNEDYKYIDKISGEEPITDDLDLRARWGVGKYRLHFNLQKVKPTDPPGEPLCVVYVDVMGDMKSWPPVDRHVSDVTRVDLAHPMNKSYVEFLRMRRQLPEQQNERADMAEAAQVETVKELVGLIRDQRNDQQDPNGSMTGHVIKETVGSIMDVARHSNELAFEGAKRAMGAYPPIEAKPDPIMSQLMPVILAKLVADPKPNEEVGALRREIETLRNDRLAEQFTALRGEIASLKNPSQVPTAANDTITTIKAMRDLFGELGIDGAAPRTEEAPWWAPILAKGLEVVASAGPQLIGAMMMQRQQAAQQTTQPQTTVTQVPNQSPAPTQAPQVEAGQALDPAVVNLLNEIKTTFMHYVRNNAAGGDYAEYFVDGHGDVVFAQLKQFGPDSIIQAIKLFPPLANQLQQESVTQERLQKFVVEFCAYEPKVAA